MAEKNVRQNILCEKFAELQCKSNRFNSLKNFSLNFVLLMEKKSGI